MGFSTFELLDADVANSALYELAEVVPEPDQHQPAARGSTRAPATLDLLSVNAMPMHVHRQGLAPPLAA